MKTRKMIGLLLLMTFILFSTSCEDDKKISESPVFDKLTISPKKIYTGQYAYGTVSYKFPGAYIYSSEYRYNVTGGESKEWKVIDPTTQEPKFKFQVPSEEGRYTVTFSAKRINYSSTGANGTIFGSASPVSTTINVLRADVINACWGDTYLHLDSVINAKDSIDENGNKFKFFKTRIPIDSESRNDSTDIIRKYNFTASGSEYILANVEEETSFDFIREPRYDDDLDDYIYDSIANYVLIDNILSLAVPKGYTSTSEYELKGELSDKYPVESWKSLSSKADKAEIANAFWKGQLTYVEIKSASDVTEVTTKAWHESDKLMLTRTYKPKNQ